MTAKRREAFLAALSACGNVTVAAERACVSRSWVVQQRRREAGFDAACRAAADAARARLRLARDNAPPEN
jgi:hypothetical protein